MNPSNPTIDRQFLEQIFDSVDGPFYVVDVRNYRVILANQAARKLGIHSGGTWATCYALTHNRTTPCSGDEHPCPLQEVVATGRPVVVEHIHYKPDGTPYIAEVHAFPLKDETGQVRYMVEYSLDVTARKKIEEALRLFRRAVEHSAHGIVITDRRGYIQYVNPAFTQMTGYTLEEVRGKTPRILKSGKHEPDFYRNLWDTILAGEVWSGIMINRRKDGSLYYEDQTIAPVPNERGEITHFVAIKRDITRRIELEQELDRAYRQAEEANRFKTRLLAALGHDIRTPLQVIYALAEHLLTKANLEKSVKEDIRQIVLMASQMQDFAEGLLAYARIESHDLHLHPRAFPPERLSERLYAVYGFLARQKGITYTAEKDATLSQVYGDEHWLFRAIANVVGNAVRYTPPGGRVHLRFEQPEPGWWAVTVRDTGPGIPEDVRDRLFEPFTTGANRVGASIGLGMYITRIITEAHGGTIEVDSQPGQGTRITLRFPMKAQSTPSAEVSHEPGSELHFLQNYRRRGTLQEGV